MNIGADLPVFSLKNQTNTLVDSATFANKPLVLFFYPKDNTPGCTAEACAFRDQFAEFRDLDAQVVGISSDSVESHQKFIAQYNLPFDLLSDPKNEVRKLFGVKGNLFGLIPGRATYIFGADGKLRHIFQSQIQAKQHIKEALTSLKAETI
jgi:thioredoxin-dependent peroxiredoxin